MASRRHACPREPRKACDPCIVMAYIVMAYIVMAYIVMAYIVMVYARCVAGRMGGRQGVEGWPSACLSTRPNTGAGAAEYSGDRE